MIPMYSSVSILAALAPPPSFPFPFPPLSSVACAVCKQHTAFVHSLEVKLIATIWSANVVFSVADQKARCFKMCDEWNDFRLHSATTPPTPVMRKVEMRSRD